MGWRDFFLGSDGYVRPCMSTAQKLFHISRYPDFWSMWNAEEYQRHRETVNQEGMPVHCANWNKITSFIQIGQNFAPDWDKKT